MNCQKCKEKMIIDEYGGWKWFCHHCGYKGRTATEIEIEENEEPKEKIIHRPEIDRDNS